MVVRYARQGLDTGGNASGDEGSVRPEDVVQENHPLGTGALCIHKCREPTDFVSQFQLVEVQDMLRIVASLALALAACALGAQAQQDKKGSDKNAALEPFKQLAGEWVGKVKHGDMEHEMRVVYKVTSGGSAVVETIDPGSDHEMVTVIHPDGDALLLTHYCMLGNQPHMKAVPKPGDKMVAFEFVKATNLKSDKDPYMRSVTFTFVDKDTVKTEWTHYNEGKEAGKAVFELKRKK
jgi:hypothetical protein